MNISKRCLASLLAVSFLLPTLASCSSSDTASGSTTEDTSLTSEAVVTDSQEEEINVDALLAENVYAQAGLELLLQTCSTYYVLRTHTLKTDLSNSGQTTVWPATAYLESLAEGYRLFPENETIKKYYVDMLDYGLAKYLVTGATLSTPSGRYKNITYYNAGAGTQGDYYYDDNAWICIQLFNAYTLLGDSKYLEQAEKLLTFFWTGWDEVYGGGIYWDKTYSGRKGICTNGPITISYLLGYKMTGNEEYLEKALLIYNWIENSGIKNSNNCYHAGISDTDRDNWVAAYDQGTMMTASTLLYELTGEKEYLTNAKNTASGSISLMFTTSGRRGNLTVTMNGNPIFRSWCIGWILRGILSYYCDKTSKSNVFMEYFEQVMDKTLETKTEDGWYDPYFCSGDWSSESTDDVMQPAGTATCLFLAATFDLYGNWTGICQGSTTSSESE
jgi:hypothetical protein